MSIQHIEGAPFKQRRLFFKKKWEKGKRKKQETGAKRQGTKSFSRFLRPDFSLGFRD